MCKTFLFKPYGGCLAYVAATWLTYSYQNEVLATDVFNQTKPVTSVSIGEVMRRSIARNGDPQNAILYHVLGDPAVLFAKGAIPLTMDVLRGGDGSVSITTHANSPESAPLKYRYEISVADTVTCLDDSSVSYTRDSVVMSVEDVVHSGIVATFPSNLWRAATYKLYVWHEHCEGRADTTIDFSSTSARPRAFAVSSTRIWFSRGILSVSHLPLEGNGEVTLAIVDVKGAQVFNTTLPARTAEAKINLGSRQLVAGNYLFCIKTGRQTFTGKITYVR